MTLSHSEATLSHNDEATRSTTLISQACHCNDTYLGATSRQWLPYILLTHSFTEVHSLGVAKLLNFMLYPMEATYASAAYLSASERSDTSLGFF